MHFVWMGAELKVILSCKPLTHIDHGLKANSARAQEDDIICIHLYPIIEVTNLTANLGLPEQLYQLVYVDSKEKQPPASPHSSPQI